jgi:hypothetical protein
MLYRIILGLLALVLLIALFSCAAGSNDGKGDSTGVKRGTAPAHRVRLLLGRSEARDSAAIVTEAFIDQALRQSLDSIPAADYVTINLRDSLAAAAVARGEKGIALSALADSLKLDGVIYTRVARFGSAIAVDLQVQDARTGRVRYRDLAFGVVRYRDTSGTILLGPTVYDVVRRSISKYFGVEPKPWALVATEPLVISSVAIDRDPKLGHLATNRQEISTEAVKALGEFARMRFPELIAFDYASRNALYELVNVGVPEDFMPVEISERTALFNVGIDHYLAATTSLTPTDSLRIRMELRYVVSPSRDSVVDAEEQTFSRTAFESTRTKEDFVIALVGLAEPIYTREVERVRRAYHDAIAGGAPATMPLR